MDKNIIIDGVNVAGCEFYECEMCSAYKDCGYTDIMCKYDNQDCYYKQLKRLEQENKELREMLSKEPKAMQAFQISYSGLKRDNETLWGMVKDYKTALEEIQKTIKSYDLTVDNGASVDTIYTIRKIINEVLGNENN